MKIETVIALRKDGTVLVTAPSGAKYQFAPDSAGRVVCDIEDGGDIAHLLQTGNYFPSNESDIPVAVALTGGTPIDDPDTEAPPQAALSAMTDADLDDEDDLPANMDAAPIETPRAPQDAPAMTGKKKKKAA